MVVPSELHALDVFTGLRGFTSVTSKCIVIKAVRTTVELIFSPGLCGSE